MNLSTVAKSQHETISPRTSGLSSAKGLLLYRSPWLSPLIPKIGSNIGDGISLINNDTFNHFTVHISPVYLINLLCPPPNCHYFYPWGAESVTCTLSSSGKIWQALLQAIS